MSYRFVVADNLRVFRQLVGVARRQPGPADSP